MGFNRSGEITALSLNRNRADNVSAIYVSIHLALPNTLSDIYACCKQAPHWSMQLFGEIRQGTLPFYYIQPSIYSIDLFGSVVNQPQCNFNASDTDYLTSDEANTSLMRVWNGSSTSADSPLRSTDMPAASI